MNGAVSLMLSALDARCCGRLIRLASGPPRASRGRWAAGTCRCLCCGACAAADAGRGRRLPADRWLRTHAAMSRWSTSREPSVRRRRNPGCRSSGLLANHLQLMAVSELSEFERGPVVGASATAGGGLSDVERTLRGALLREGRRCSSERCRCRRGELHGPYTYLAVYVDGRSRMVYVPAAVSELAERARAGRAAQRGVVGGDLAGQPRAAQAAGAAVMCGGGHRRRGGLCGGEHARRCAGGRG